MRRRTRRGLGLLARPLGEGPPTTFKGPCRPGRSVRKPALSILAAALLSLGGCLSDGEGAAPNGPEGAAPGWSVSYACGPGHDLPLPGGGCHGRLEGGAFTLGEPQVALHPTDAQTFAIAVSDGRRPDGLVVDSPSPEPRGLAVYVTQDGGATFSRHAVDLQSVGSLPVNPGAMGADPSITFTPDGVLHLAGLIVTGSAGTLGNPVSLETTLFTLRSMDLGASWDPATVVAESASNDREWLESSADGDVALTWRDHTQGNSAFRVGAGGVEPSASVNLECTQVSNAVWVDAVALVACQVDGDLTVFELSSPPTPRGTAQGACPTNSARLAATPQGALVASCYYGTMAISLDGGWTWGKTIDAFETLHVDDGWSSSMPSIFALGADAAGRVHMTLSVFRFQQAGSLQEGRPVAHVVVDPATGAFVHEVELQPQADGGSPMGIGWADDFYSIDFVGGRGMLVWTSSDWSTHFAVLAVPGAGAG